MVARNQVWPAVQPRDEWRAEYPDPSVDDLCDRYEVVLRAVRACVAQRCFPDDDWIAELVWFEDLADMAERIAKWRRRVGLFVRYVLVPAAIVSPLVVALFDFFTR